MSALIVGAGPAGCAAALALAARGVRPRVIERDRQVRDAICGGFMSWRTLAALDRLGVVVAGHPIGRVVVFAGKHRAEAPLPARAIGLSRRALDAAMRAAVTARGLAIDIGVEARGFEARHVRLSDGSAHDGAVFLATGKHDLRGLPRPRAAADPTLGLRLRLAPHPGLTRLIGDAIELHLTDRAYVGLMLQEDGSANLCLAVRKSRLAEVGGRPEALLAALGEGTPLGERLGYAAMGEIDAIASVPYGWRTATTLPGLYRLGDQAAVIPSLAGEGIGIAVASGIAAAQGFADGQSAPDWQAGFARRTRRPVAAARLLWLGAERPWVARGAVPLLAAIPALAGLGARLTRIGD